MKHDPQTTTSFISHPRAGASFRTGLDYALCVVVGSLVRQVTAQTEAVLALRQALASFRVAGVDTSVPDDPLDLPHLEEFTLRLYSELVSTSARLELAYRHLQRSRAAVESEIADRPTDPGDLMGSD